jgi:tRNA (uracil-5-)-methyltransferase
MSETKESTEAPAELIEATTQEVAVTKPISDEFAYIENKGFTSEIYKLEVRNLPKYYGINELKKLLNNKLSLASNKIKVPRQGSPFAYICFRSEEEVESAISKLDGFNWKGKELQASRAKPAPDPMAKKRNLEAGVGGVIVPKKRKTLEEATTPLAYLPYEAQLKQKSSEMEEVLKKFGNELWKQGCRDYVEAQRKLNNGLPCQFEGIRASPDDVVANGYRNKNEFSIGKDSSEEAVVGFRLGSYANGTIEVGHVDELKHLPKIAKDCCKVSFVSLKNFVF